MKQINVELFKTVETLIYCFSKRKIFDNNLDVNCDKLWIWNKLWIIKELLRKSLLYGKKQFNDLFNYIIYQGESNEMIYSNIN